MSGSETAVNVMTPQPPATMQNMRLAFSADGTAVYKPITATSPTYQPSSGGGGGGDASSGGRAITQGLNMNMGSGSGSEPMKRKRGRPRKYGPEGTMSLALVPSPSSVTTAGNQSGSGSGFSSPGGGPLSPDSMKKSRGRPLGSGKKHQLEALGSAGVGFTPHVLTVKAGEDVSSKIMSFSQNGPRAVCVLSANGAISNVTLRQAATSGGSVTYQGRFEILSLSGSFLLSEISGQRSRTGGLSVSLSGPDGRVLGGSVAGLLTAATPIQVIIGSFLTDGRKESKSSHHMESPHAPPKLAPGALPAGQNSPPSRGTLSESSGGPGSPPNHSTGACNNNHPHGMATSIPWK